MTLKKNKKWGRETDGQEEDTKSALLKTEKLSRVTPFLAFPFLNASSSIQEAYGGKSMETRQF